MAWYELNGGPREAMRRIQNGQKAALTAQGQVVRNAWKLKMVEHHGGFTSGNFSTGTAVAHITQTPPKQEGTAFQWVVRVGTNLRYHLFWEVGHHNLFTRKYERVPTLAPAMEETKEEQRAAYARTFLKAVGL